MILRSKTLFHLAKFFILVSFFSFFLTLVGDVKAAHVYQQPPPCNSGDTNLGPGDFPGTVKCQHVDTSVPGSSGGIPVIGTIDKSKVPAIDLNTLIENGVLVALALGGLIFFAMLMFGGFKYLSSGGDEKAMSEARRTLTAAFIGLIIIVASFLIFQLLDNLFKLRGVGLG